MFFSSMAQEGRFVRFDQKTDANNQYLHLFLQAQVAIGILRGPDMVIELANEPLLGIWGKSNEVVGSPLMAALPEIAGTEYPGLLHQVFSTGITHHARENSAFLVRNGVAERVYFNFVYQPLYDSEKEITGVMIIAHEVTEQVEARKKVEESEKRFRNLVEVAEVATAIYWGRDMIIQLANDAMLRLWGKDHSVIGRPLREALPELEGQPFHQLLDRVFTTGEIYRASEDRADLVVDGQLTSFYFNFSYKPLRNASGEVYAILNMATDVTEMVRAKQQLVQSENRLRLAADIAELGTWDYYPDEHRIVWDDRCRELYGFPPGLASDVQINNDMIHPEDRERTLASFARAFEPGSGGAFFEEYRIIRKGDAAIRHLRSKGQIIFNPDGKPQHMTGTLQDITEQQLKAAILEQKVEERTHELKAAVNQLMESNQELEQFAHVASHDLKEPIRKVRLFADLLKNEFADRLPPTATRYLDKIETATNRMTQMVEGVLHYSLLNEQPEPFQPIRLSSILEQIGQDLELPITEKKARLQYGDIPSFDGAPVLIYQLFYNLINNALKFSRPEVAPVIILSCSLPQVAGTETGLLELRLCDNGIGFDTAEADYIFQTFSRLHPRDVYEGTGLGLALCRKIVARHHGTIRAEGKKDKGACFIITLPLHQKGGL